MAKPSPIPFFILHGHDGNISALHFHNQVDDILRNKPILFSGSEIGEIFIWDLKTFRTIFRLYCPDKVTILFLNYHKSILLSQDKAGIINFWSYANRDWCIIRKLVSDSVGFCSSYLWTNNNETCVSLINQDKHILHIYHIENADKVNIVSVNSSAGMCMCTKVIQMEEKWFIINGYETGEIGLYDCAENCEKSLINFHKEIITCLDFDVQHKMRGISGSANEFLIVWKINNLQLEKVSQINLPSPGVNSVKIRDDGKIVITAGLDYTIRVFSWKTLKPLAILLFHESSVQCLAFCTIPIDKRKSVFASGSKDKNIALWTIY